MKLCSNEFWLILNAGGAKLITQMTLTCPQNDGQSPFEVAWKFSQIYNVTLWLLKLHVDDMLKGLGNLLWNHNWSKNP